MKVAFSHDWLNGMRGGEKCLEALCELYPESDIYTLFHEKGKVNGAIAARRIFTSPIQNLPGVFRSYRYYLPFFPQAIEAFDLEGYDVVVSTSHCVAKGIRKNRGAVHICYCFTPMRYAWGLFEEYFGRRGALMKRAIQFFLKRIRHWDRRTSGRVDRFVAISSHVKDRIAAHYGREADVVYPPVDTDFFVPDPAVPAEDFYLVVSALVPYKKIELAIEAFSRNGRRLVVIGSGPEEPYLRSIAARNIEFLGWQPDAVLRDRYRRARALIFPGEEDFGIVPVEVQACGRFVIAYGKGGALETVKDGTTGVFFHEPTVGSLCDAVARFESLSLDGQEARRNAMRFSRERFKEEIDAVVRGAVRGRVSGAA
jgi:glycosyltransferase involved in cell wall biosynthesis